MNRSSATPFKTGPLDEDLAERIHPGHGVPSQAPEAAAEAGATVGVAAVGPVVVLMGGTLGAVVGVSGAVDARTMVNLEDFKRANTASADTERQQKIGVRQKGQAPIEGQKGCSNMLKVYGFSRVNATARDDTRGLRVLWPLEETQFPFERVGMDHLAHYADTDEYRRFSPFKQTPAKSSPPRRHRLSSKPGIARIHVEPIRSVA